MRTVLKRTKRDVADCPSSGRSPCTTHIYRTRSVRAGKVREQSTSDSKTSTVSAESGNDPTANHEMSYSPRIKRGAVVKLTWFLKKFLATPT